MLDTPETNRRTFSRGEAEEVPAAQYSIQLYTGAPGQKQMLIEAFGRLDHATLNSRYHINGQGLTVSIEDFLRGIDSATAVLLCFNGHGSSLVGWAEMFRVPNAPHQVEFTLLVMPEHRRNGIAKLLALNLIETARGIPGVSKGIFYVEVKNYPILRLLYQMGQKYDVDMHIDENPLSEVLPCTIRLN